MHERILVIGAGAIGGVTAALLKRAGYDVCLVCKYPELAETITSSGMRVSGMPGVFEQRIPAVAAMDELEGTFRVVLIATKALDMMTAARDVLPYLTEDTLVVSMQNGMCEDALAGIIGPERTVGCVVGWGATLHQPGWVEMTSGGEFIIGSLPGYGLRGLEGLQQALSHIVPARITGNIYGHLYSKLIINSCITSLGAVSGMILGPMLARRKVRLLFIEIMREAMAVADRMGIEVEAFANKLDYKKLLKGDGWVASIRRHLFIRLLGLKYRRLKSSSLQSLERGKKTESDFFNGYIVQKARQHGVPVPLNEKVTEMVKAIERGAVQIQPGNLDQLQA